MRTLPVISTLALAAALASTGSSAIGLRQQVFTARYDNILGTSLDIKVLAPSRAAADRAESAVLNEIERQSRILNSWSQDSEVSRWTRTHGEAVPVSKELFEVLGLYDQWSLRTHGALNASAGTIISVWKDAEKAGRLPSRTALESAIASVSGPQWKLDTLRGTATHTGEASLVLASFTKSYIMEHAAAVAMRDEIGGIVVNIGGDIVARGRMTEPVDIANPRDDAENAKPLAQVMLENSAIATSGDYRRGFAIGGKRYSHIVDPRTGAPVENIISATVTAPRATDAGALATAFTVLRPEESAKLAASMPGVAYLLVKANGERIASRNWNGAGRTSAPLMMATNFRAASSRLGIAPAVTAGAPWDPSMELTINFELATFGGGAKRPFVAAWIEDKDRFQLRTLAVWYHEDRWVTEMKAWFRSDRMRAMADGKEIFHSISSATRAPGKYSFKWDGKDNDGKLVKNGKYTVYLEVVREHGTYQLMKQEMDMTGTPKVVTFPANTEVLSSSFDYHKLSK